MNMNITWDGTKSETSESHAMAPGDERRNATRVTPSWRVQIDLEDCLSVSMPLADLSVRTFRIGLGEMLEIGAEVQFSISEDTNECLDGLALRGRAIVVLTHAKGTAFEFQDFEGNDFNRLCDALLKIIEGPVYRSA